MKKLLSILLLGGSLILTGCGDSSDVNQISGLQGNPGGITVPVCVDDAYTTNQNAALTVNAANGVLANDNAPGGVVTFDTASTQGGTVAGNADGSFVYTPPGNNFNGTDTFTYTVTNALGQATCTVTITVQAINGFFVDSVNGNDGTGSFNGGLPFQTVQAAVTAAGTNQDIVVLPGNYTGTVNLLNGQRLLGSGSGLVNPQGGIRPVFSGQIIMADGNTIDFIESVGVNGDAIDAPDSDGGTISNCIIRDNSGAANNGVDAVAVSGNWDVSNNTCTNLTGIGVVLTSDLNDNLTATINNNDCTNNELGCIGFTAGQNAMMNVQVVGNTMTGTVNAGGSFQVLSGDSAIFCADITGNTNDDAYQFLVGGSSDCNVEEFGNLLGLNSGSAVIDVALGTVDDVMDGTCGF